MAKKVFPDQLYVSREEPERDEAYLTTYESLDEMNLNDGGKKIAVYRLERVVTLKVSASLD